MAVEGMKLGASDFISKPWDNSHMLSSVRMLLSLFHPTKAKETSISRKRLDELYDFRKIIGEDPALLSILEIIGRASSTEAPILIQGESGTGKELIAEAIHMNSSRHNHAFVKVNLGGISSSLFESEMFGHKRGAFTDAKEERVGRFTLANKGSIFLDEVGDLELSSQVKLLRILQDRTYEVLGDSKARTADIRVICATNRNLEEMVEQNKFREDLFYRINLITIKLPSLRERPRDIPLLVKYFIQNLKEIYQKDKLEVSNKALKWLMELPLPGNIRELKNLVERTVLISGKDLLEIEDFLNQIQSHPKKSKGSFPLGDMTIDQMELELIKRTMAHFNHNISKVAKSLGLSRGALYRRLDKYGIQYENKE
ncbi:sigma-54 dependent transcriptional regulator [Pedobacter lusitanus]|uniref:sigma-54 dependent transcriptional regulator n=1 Tax=Pedobacter lusitanus TaxID=1503925 RepID=UPI00190F9935|nr:sigma-54 dependent transcriptional regulator [Pedobacter lusitanus]